MNDTRAVILGFLHMGPMNGGQIAKRAEAAMDGFFSVTRSQLYRELPLMEADGQVKAADKGARNSQEYAITAAGRKAFSQWMEDDPKVIIRDGRKAREYLSELLADAPEPKKAAPRKKAAKKTADAPKETPAKKSAKKAPAKAAKKTTRKRTSE